MSSDLANRPTSSTSPYGAVTNYSYSESTGLNQSASSYTYYENNVQKTRRRWVKTYVDGFGRPRQIVTGSGPVGGEVTDSIVDRVYEPCACSPIGKLKKVSQPYRPGQTPVWTVYTYDFLGRTKAVTHPPNTGTSGNSGVTTYEYATNSVKVTPPTPANRPAQWKKYWNDAFGNLGVGD